MQFYLDDFRKKFNLIRSELGITTERLCELLGITRQSLSSFENERGTFKIINALAISLIFDYYIIKNNVPIDQLRDLAIARIDVTDYIFSDAAIPRLPTLSYAWQRKQDCYLCHSFTSALLDENEIGKFVLFIDIFSFLDDEFIERFLLWMLRITKYQKANQFDVYIDSAISETQELSKEIYVTQILNALSDVKQQGLINLFAMKANDKNYLKSVRSIIAKQNYCNENNIVVSSDIEILSECQDECPALLSVDGLLIRLSGMGNVLRRLKKTEERNIETKIAAIPNKLLNSLFEQ